MDSYGQHRRDQLPLTRRSFLVVMGGVAAGGAVVLGSGRLLEYLFPNAVIQAPPKFIVSGLRPSDVTVDNPYMDYGRRVGIIRDDAGIYAVRLICTHLGCTPNFTTDVVTNTLVPSATADAHGVRRPSERIPDGWACPCHGSRYFIDSTNFYGPAPRPMDWVEISLADTGEFLVDTSKLVVMRGAGDIRTPRWRMDPVSGKNNGLTLGV